LITAIITDRGIWAPSEIARYHAELHEPLVR
jgi:hypothetical protein